VNSRNALPSVSDPEGTKASLYAVIEGQCLFCHERLERGWCERDGVRLDAHAAPMADGRPQVEVQITYGDSQTIWGWNAEIGIYSFHGTAPAAGGLV
jgi:hypothetical protein